MKERIEQLDNELAKYIGQGICIAFSGGVDSSLLLKSASLLGKQCNKPVYAVLFSTSLHSKGDAQEAEVVAMECGANFVTIPVNELDNPEILQNPVNRCYFCKKYLFGKLMIFARKVGCKYILDGTNEDDLHRYRPGLAALKELGVISPLADLHITKEEVRQMAAFQGISTASKPSNSCMATRIPYGTPLDFKLLAQIEQAEQLLRGHGFNNVRVRVHGDIARVEIDKSQFAIFYQLIDEINLDFSRFPFKYVTLDLAGFRSGSMDL